MLTCIGSSLQAGRSEAPAIDLALRREVAGLATFSSFTGMTEMAGRHFPFLPVALLLRHRFESERKIAWVTCPVFVGHGRADGLIPFEMSERLAAAAKRPVTRLTIDEADHNDFFSSGGRCVLDVFSCDSSRKLGNLAQLLRDEGAPRMGAQGI